MKCVAVIPARYQSTRLPGKSLRDIAGKPMIQHVYERAARCPAVERVLVATDDERILQVVQRFGGEAMMTSPDHTSGSERMAEVAGRIDADLFVNIQGDEPLIDVATIEAAVNALRTEARAVVATPKIALHDIEAALSPHVVKVTTDQQDYALYFSRWPIPFHQVAGSDFATYADYLRAHPALVSRCYKHIGLYVFRADFLRRFAQLPATPLEKAERLEQLRILEHGYTIKVVEVNTDSIGVDTEEDLQRIRQMLEEPK